MTQAVSRRNFLKSVGEGAAAAALSAWLPRLAAAGEGPDRLNVLFIGADDLRCELACYGRSHIHSQNIDRLAHEGVLFQRAYVQQAVCAASRASFLTGCRPDTTTVDYPYNDYFREEFLREHPTLHTYFHQRGYYARCLGKIHHGWVDDLARLSEPYFSGGKTGGGGWRGYVLPANIEKAEQGSPPPTEMADVADTGYRDGRVAEETVATLRRAAEQDKPFFLSVGFYKPHLPFAAPKRYWDLYDRDKIDLSPNPYIPDGAPPYAPASFELPSYEGQLCKDGAPVAPDTARLLRHAYYACVSFIDAQIGKVLDELERLGLRDNTVVMLWGDHGWHLGDNGCWGKHTNYERATHAPMIVSAPGFDNAGAVCDALVEYVDIFPTLTELSGLETPGYCEGLSMVPLLREPNREWKDAAFSQYPRGNMEGYAIRTDRYRYVEWRKKSDSALITRELYDHHIDGIESTSIAGRPENEALVAELAKRLRAGWRAALP